MTLAVYAGSFDPVTNGHLWVIEQGSRLFGSLIVAVGVNPQKRSSYTFSLEERLAMLSEVTRGFPNVAVDTMGENYLIDFALSRDATHIFRGIRSAKDWEEERSLKIGSEGLREARIDWVYTSPPPEGIANISSSFVKGLIGYNGWEAAVDKSVPRPVSLKLWERFGNFKRWKEFCSRLVEASGDEVFARLAASYGSPPRAYHNLRHVDRCLDEFDGARSLAQNPDAVEMALWFHDAVYDAKNSKDNELKSASLAYNCLTSLGLPESFAESVRALVLATRHSGLPEVADAKVLCDLDLAILGASPDAFDVYESQIRQEYAHVPELDFRSGRSAILQRFLDREHIYSTSHFREKYKQRARENLQRSIARLSP